MKVMVAVLNCQLTSFCPREGREMKAGLLTENDQRTEFLSPRGA